MPNVILIFFQFLCVLFTLFLHVVDSKNFPEGARVAVPHQGYTLTILIIMQYGGNIHGTQVIGSNMQELHT